MSTAIISQCREPSVPGLHMGVIFSVLKHFFNTDILAPKINVGFLV